MVVNYLSVCVIKAEKVWSFRGAIHSKFRKSHGFTLSYFIYLFVTIVCACDRDPFAFFSGIFAFLFPTVLADCYSTSYPTSYSKIMYYAVWSYLFYSIELFSLVHQLYFMYTMAPIWFCESVLFL